MELRQLQTFIQIAQMQSFSRTAEMLGYSQSAVTVPAGGRISGACQPDPL